MPLDALRQITQAEADAARRKADAARTAREMIEAAHLAGEETLRSAAQRADAQVRQTLQQAEESAKRRAAEIAEQCGKECGALRAAAERRLDDAAALIVRKVVER